VRVLQPEPAVRTLNEAVREIRQASTPSPIHYVRQVLGSIRNVRKNNSDTKLLRKPAIPIHPGELYLASENPQFREAPKRVSNRGLSSQEKLPIVLDDTPVPR
jgi:hypothetical protein